VDTGAFIALADRSDEHHQRARIVLARLRENRIPLVTTNWVLWETVFWIQRNRGKSQAVETGDRIRGSRRLLLLPVPDALEKKAWSRFRREGDPSVSLADCVSFAVMEEFLIRDFFGFDRHFLARGFRPA